MNEINKLFHQGLLVQIGFDILLHVHIRVFPKIMGKPPNHPICS